MGAAFSADNARYGALALCLVVSFLCMQASDADIEERARIAVRQALLMSYPDLAAQLASTQLT